MSRKPLCRLSERQKRNLRLGILKSMQESDVQNESTMNNSRYQKKAVAITNENKIIGNTGSSTSSIIGATSDGLQFDRSCELPEILDDLNASNCNNEQLFFDSDDASSSCSCGDCSFTENPFKVHKLVEDLRIWAVECNVPLAHTTKLLQILKTHNLDVPSDARTLLHTPRTVGDLRKVEPGEYSHIGIKTSILKDLNSLPTNVQVSSYDLKLNFNIDGLPLSKSSGSQFWPILGWICPGTFSDFNFRPFVVGIFHGFQKPKSSNELLKDFIDEMLELKETGITWRDSTFNIHVNALICDSPARAFVTCTKSHTGYHSCSKCIQEGDYIANRMTFGELGSVLRTDESFKNKLDEDHHIGTSDLEKLNIGMVSQIPLDYMHLVCLGVMKRLLQFWCKGRQDVRIPMANLNTVSELFISFKKFVTNDFSRKPRTLLDIDRYKATEFRQILLYTGIVALKDFLPENLYIHFLYLSCAIRILVSPNLCIALNDSAQEFINTFVLDYGPIYGREYITHNVHNLVHLCSDVLNFGCLDNFSAFSPESYMYHLKQRICTRSSKPLQQIVKRLSEEPRKPNCLKTTVNIKSNCSEFNFNGTILTNRTPDNYCLLKNGTFISISKILGAGNNFSDSQEISIEGNIVVSLGNFFGEPLDSRALGIHRCKFSEEVVTYKISDIITKVVLIPYHDEWVVLPLIHKLELSN